MSSPTTDSHQRDTGTSLSADAPSLPVKQLRLFAFGSNSLGQLSIGSIEDAHTPTEVLLPPRTLLSDISIVSGGNHTFLISKPSGIIYSVGDNAFGQSATSWTPDGTQVAQAKTTAFAAIPPPTPTSCWMSVSAGWQFSILLSSENQLYACGNGPRGELGLSASVTTSPTPTLISGFPPSTVHISQLVSSVEHTLALLSDGSIYGWGNGRKGQLGTLPAGEKHLWSPTKLQLDELNGFQAIGVAAGREFSAFISRGGEVRVVGHDKWGAIRLNPLSTNLDLDWAQFMAGWSTIHVLKGNGRVVSWGRSTHGQLPPGDIPELYRVAAGSEHAIALGRDGRVYAWGWGEHGNCGPLAEGRGEVVRWKQVVAVEGAIGVEYRVEGIAAGCATSWIWVSQAD